MTVKYNSVMLALLPALYQGYASANEQNADKPQKDKTETIFILGESHVMRTEPGSAHFINEASLEQYEYNDIHRILSQVPGVNFREEDGYGLRPNIGIRGAATERSGKIALMEDGILIAPAPYAAPSAYYFPLVTRMQAVEVFKGPATIQHGPNTIGGAVNMVSRSLPNETTGLVDLGIAEDALFKAHSYIGSKSGDWSWLIEGVHLQSDGFKTLDTGGDTGFDKNELLLKAGWSPKTTGPVNHQLSFTLTYSDEISDETYLGLTDADFAESPLRRYAASQLDQMEWTHSRLSATHLAEWQTGLTLVSKAYRLDFDRAWTKLNRFNTNSALLSLQNILANPTTGTNRGFYNILTGEQDSFSDPENLQIGTNDRRYYSQGLQFTLSNAASWLGLEHEWEIGLRLHQDEVERHHTEELFRMASRRLLSTGTITDRLINNDRAQSVAVHLQDEITIDDLRLTLGLRGEHIRSEAQRTTPNPIDIEDDYTVLMPGIGSFYALSDNLGILAGVYRGFVPNKPGQQDIDPELSVNYELGLRYSKGVSIELLGFYNDYTNLVGVCTFSAGCVDDVDREFNGGEVEIKGLEAGINYAFDLGSGWELPIGLTYTLTQTAFQTSFESDFSQWGSVEEGDELPYVPEHQLALSIGLSAANWQFNILGKYTSEMLETAGRPETTQDGGLTDEATVIDVAASYNVNPALSFYVSLDNALDEAVIVSRRPFGARPGKPRRASLGFKYRF